MQEVKTASVTSAKLTWKIFHVLIPKELWADQPNVQEVHEGMECQEKGA